jgi:hypothetical protein
MHLGLKTGPFYPMFCIKRSPVRLAKFQMAPTLSLLISSGSKKEEPRYICSSEAKASLRLKILMTSGSKKGTQIYFCFLSKLPANEPPLGSPRGPLWRGRPAYRAFCISLKKTSSFWLPSKAAIPQGPLHGIPRREQSSDT